MCCIWFTIFCFKDTSICPLGIFIYNFLLCYFLLWFGYQDNGSIEWIWKISFLFLLNNFGNFSISPSINAWWNSPVKPLVMKSSLIQDYSLSIAYCQSLLTIPFQFLIASCYWPVHVSIYFSVLARHIHQWTYSFLLEYQCWHLVAYS